MDAPSTPGTDAARAPGGGNGRPKRIVALLNQKGGVGKTTTTVNLAAAFAERGRRILLVDLDPQAHLTLHFGLETGSETLSVYDLLLDPEVRAEEVIQPARPNIDVMLSEVDLAAAEVELAGRAGRECILREKLTPVLGAYELVMFDCPPSLGLLTLSGLACAGCVLVPMQAHFLPLQGVGKLLETVGLVRSAVNPALEVAGIILCAHEGNTTLAREIVADLESFFEGARGQDVAWRDCRILEPAIRRNIKLAEAPSFGQTIFDYAPWCAGANDYRALAEGLDAQWFRHNTSASGADRAAAPRSVEVKTPLRIVEGGPSSDSDDVATLRHALDSLENAFAPSPLPFPASAHVAGPSISNS